MGLSSYPVLPLSALRPAVLVAFAGLLVGSQVGCQTTSRATNRKLIAHQALIDFSGLKPAERFDGAKVTCAIPRQWQALGFYNTPLYAHQQWRLPSGHTGVGVAHVRLPLPLSEKALIWLAKREYTKKANDGRVIDQWTDEVGRNWFEAENNKYHVRGYLIVRGFNAWFIYFGFKTGYPPDLAELSLAARCLQTFVPDTSPPPKPTPPTTPPQEAEIAASEE